MQWAPPCSWLYERLSLTRLKLKKGLQTAISRCARHLGTFGRHLSNNIPLRNRLPTSLFSATRHSMSSIARLPALRMHVTGCTKPVRPPVRLFATAGNALHAPHPLHPMRRPLQRPSNLNRLRRLPLDCSRRAVVFASIEAETKTSERPSGSTQSGRSLPGNGNGWSVKDVISEAVAGARCSAVNVRHRQSYLLRPQNQCSKSSRAFIVLQDFRLHSSWCPSPWHTLGSRAARLYRVSTPRPWPLSQQLSSPRAATSRRGLLPRSRYLYHTPSGPRLNRRCTHTVCCRWDLAR